MSRLIIPPMECAEEGCTAADKNAFYCSGCEYEHLPWFEAGEDTSPQPDQTGYPEESSAEPTEAESDPLVEALQQAAAAIVQFVETVVDAVVTTIKRIAKAFTKLWEQVLKTFAAATHPKWLHYYKHSKKRRVRKKYYSLIKRQFFRELLTSGTSL